MMAAIRIAAQDHDMSQPCDSLRPNLEIDDVSAPKRIPFLLDTQIFIPYDRLAGLVPWHYAPMTRPIVLVIPRTGISGTVGFGEFSQEHPEKFFSTLEGYNSINIPQLYLTQQMMIGNTIKIARNFYLANGILYGAQLGVEGNNWGLGNREGFLWRPKPTMAILVWNQYFQSLTVYTPVLYPRADGNSAAIVMPATPEVFSFGVQASFNVGHFIIGVGTSVSPVPFQDRKKSKFRYR